RDGSFCLWCYCVGQSTTFLPSTTHGSTPPPLSTKWGDAISLPGGPGRFRFTGLRRGAPCPSCRAGCVPPMGALARSAHRRARLHAEHLRSSRGKRRGGRESFPLPTRGG